MARPVVMVDHSPEVLYIELKVSMKRHGMG